MIPSRLRIWVCTQPIDMRKSFDGLGAATREFLQKDPESEGLFVFVNKRGNRLKALWWDRSGYCLLYKRLEWGQFRLPQALDQSGPGVPIAADELQRILLGVGLPSKRHRMYARVLKEKREATLQRGKAGGISLTT